MSSEHVVHLGAWGQREKVRADQVVEILRRLEVDVACLIFTDWGDLDVITCEELSRHQGREQQLLAAKYSRMVQDRAREVGIAC